MKTVITLKLSSYSLAEVKTLSTILAQNRDLVVKTFCEPELKCHACKVRHLCEDFHSTTEHLARITKNPTPL